MPERRKLVIVLTFILLMVSVVIIRAYPYIGAKGNGMGGAYITLTDDISSVYWNPAGLSGLEGFEVLVEDYYWRGLLKVPVDYRYENEEDLENELEDGNYFHHGIFSHTSQDSTSWLSWLPSTFSAGISWREFGFAVFSNYNCDRNNEVETEISKGGLGVAYKIHEDYALGLSIYSYDARQAYIPIFKEGPAGYCPVIIGSGTGFKVGVIAKPSEYFMLGLVSENNHITSLFRYGPDDDVSYLINKISLGLGFLPIKSIKTEVKLERIFDAESKYDFRFHTGIEYSRELFAFRLGYMNLRKPLKLLPSGRFEISEGEKNHILTVGTSVNWKDFQVNFVWENNTILANPDIKENAIILSLQYRHDFKSNVSND